MEKNKIIEFTKKSHINLIKTILLMKNLEAEITDKSNNNEPIIIERINVLAEFKDWNIFNISKYDSEGISCQTQNKINTLIIDYLTKKNQLFKNDYTSNIITKVINTRPLEFELNWIDRLNKRQCYYIASVLYLSRKLMSPILELNHEQINISNLINFEHDVVNGKMPDYIPRYHISNHLNLKDPHSINILYDHILLNLIHMITYVQQMNKLDVIEIIKESWIDTYNEQNYDWICKDNKEQINWIFDYLKKNRLSAWFLPNIDSESHLHKYHSCITVLDLWHPSQNIKDLDNKYKFIEKMKKSLSQQKCRLKNKNKKSFSFSMNGNVGLKIDRLCKINNINKSKLIEKLINNAYDEIVDN
ncbi:hypothetical protein SNE98_001339 [Vibrio cholerae]|nr:hypothetical protein [Vibrio cholerae]